MVEAAIKNLHRTKQAWANQNYELGFESLSRAQDIIAEILSSLDPEGNPEIAKQLAAIYLFIFKRLAESGMDFDIQKIDDALRVLNVERETWKLVCEKFGATVGQTPSGDNRATGTASVGTPGGTAATAGPTKVLVPTSGTYSAPSQGAATKLAAPSTPPAAPRSGYASSSLGGSANLSSLSLGNGTKQSAKPAATDSGSSANWDA